MPGTKVLNEDWSEYDNRKLIRTDRLFFSCEESWEVDYLKKVIRKTYPGKFTDAQVMEAISSCCRTTTRPRPRKDFVNCVMRRLG